MSEQTFTTTRDAKAQAKAEKAYRKASRPLWKKKRLWLALALLGLLLLIVLAAALSGGSTPAAEDEGASGTGTIVLEVGGTATSAGITFNDGGVQTSQENGATLPWRKEIPVNEDMLITYQVMAQNAGGGDITCKITGADGEVLTENTSSGEFAIVSCNS